jgi:hypothetical protein
MLRQEEQGTNLRGRDFDNVLTERSYRPRVRALLATAGLLVLAGAGSAAAGQPTAHTLRKSPKRPIEAIAQDASFAAWFTSSTQACDIIHVLSPGKRDRYLPQPSSGSMTCHWDLSEGPSELAFASRMSTAVWTLHESGPAPVDFVLAASIGGPERQLQRFSHAGDGTGHWLGGVAGSGRTLAYSWVDVEYVDKLGCLNGGSCKKKIANGGIQLVSRTDVAPLPGAEPALQLAAAAGRLAYIPASKVAKDGHAEANARTPLQVVDPATGESVSQVSPHGVPLALALASHVLAVLTQNSRRDRLSWYDPTDGTKLGSVSVPRRTAPQVVANDRLVVYRVGRVLHGVATRNGHSRVLVKTGSGALGLSLARGRLIWAENRGTGGRLRALTVS